MRKGRTALGVGRVRTRERDGHRVWILDYRDEHGVRHEPTFDSEEALQTFAEGLAKTRRLDPTVSADMTVEQYAQRWLHDISAKVEKSTIVGYESTVRHHVIPRMGKALMGKMKHRDIVAMLTDLLRDAKTTSKNPRNLVRRTKHVLHAMFDMAVTEELVAVNPVKGAARKLDLTSKVTKLPKAMDREQLRKLLATTQAEAPDLYMLFLTMARTGLRPGEAYAMERANLDLDAGTYFVEHAKCSYLGELSTPKTDGSQATISLTHSPQLMAALRAHVATLPPGCPWVLPSSTGGMFHHRVVGNRLRDLLTKAGLPTHFTPHGFRHTYASQALAGGESILFVQQQLRHKLLAMTTDLYGKWLPKTSVMAAGKLDDVESKSSLEKPAA